MRITPLLLVLCTGALVLTAYYLPGAWPLIFIALVPLHYAIHTSKNRWHAFWLGSLAGFCIVGGTAAWMFDVRPLPFLEAQPLLNFSAIFFSWCVITFSMTPLIGVWAVAVKGLKPDRIIDAGASAVLWVACEYLRMHSFNLATHAPGMDNPAFFSIGFIGYPLADSAAWLQFASLAGIYALSFCVILVNAFFFYALRHRNMRQRLLFIGSVAAMVLIISALPLAELRRHQSFSFERDVRIGIMSIHALGAEVEAEDALAYQDQVAQGIKEAVKEGASVILLPEGARFFSRAEREMEEGGPLIIDSDVEETERGNVLRSFARTAAGGLQLPLRDKQILTPQGEYLISVFKAVVAFAGFGDQADEAERNMALVNGSRIASLVHDGIRGSVIFCVEIFSPGLGKNIVRAQGDNALFVALSYARFYESGMLERDTLRLLKVQAVEADVPIISSAYFTFAYVIDRFGTVIGIAGDEGITETSVISVPVQAL